MANFIVGGIVLIIFVSAVLYMIKNKDSCASCGAKGGCHSCSHTAKKNKDDENLKPLI